MSFALGVLMAVHGFAHLVGFIAFWRLAVFENMAYKTTVLAGRFDVGDFGVRILGLLWLLAAVGFELAAAGALANSAWWAPLSLTLSGASLVLCFPGWPDSRIGVPVNAATRRRTGVLAHPNTSRIGRLSDGGTCGP